MGTHTYMGGEKGFLYIRASENPFFFCLTADRIFFWGEGDIADVAALVFFEGNLLVFFVCLCAMTLDRKTFQVQKTTTVLRPFFP